MTFQNLRITFHLRTPVVLTYPFITLDSIVAHLGFREKLGESYYTLPSKTPVDCNFSSTNPIAKYRLGDGPDAPFFRCASIAFFDCPLFFSTKMYKRFDEARCASIATKRTKISLGSGPLRNWAMSLAYLPATKAVFYAKANAEELRRSLAHLPALGKEANVGWGEISSFDIEEIEEDWAVVKDGKAQRMIPQWALRSYEELVPMAYRSPYWDKRNVELCAPPGTKVELVM